MDLALPPDATTVAAAFAATAHRFGSNSFLSVLPETASIYGIEAGELGYATALAEVEHWRAAYRQAGFGFGHRVGLLLENRPAFFLHWFALNGLGVSVVPINPDLRASELEYLVSHSEIVAALVLPSRQADVLAAAEAKGIALPVYAPGDAPPVLTVAAPRSGAPDVNSECALLYTSGTTGQPKGCVLPNKYFLYAGHWYATIGGLIALEPGCERMLTPLPIFHMNAMAYSAMAMVAVGGCLIVVDRFHPRSWWQNVRESKATIIHYLGVMPSMLIGAPDSAEDKAHTVRFGFGAGVDQALHVPFEERFGFPLIEAWAMTETGAGAVVVASNEPRHRGTRCFGKPSNELEVRIVGEDGAEAATDMPGELLVRHKGSDPHYGFFRNYLKDEAATLGSWEGGWFHTGDVVRRGPDGSLHFIDRKKNVIRRSGENIAAVEVEGVLLQHKAVRAVAVAPVADPVRGDEVFACIVVEGGCPADEATAHDIVAWCLSRLAYYKAPGYVAFVSAIPLTSTQKIQRGSLKQLIEAELGGPACFDTRSMKKRGGH